MSVYDVKGKNAILISNSAPKQRIWSTSGQPLRGTSPLSTFTRLMLATGPNSLLYGMQRLRSLARSTSSVMALAFTSPHQAPSGILPEFPLYLKIRSTVIRACTRPLQ
ncbi:hypothetical protein LB505_010790 [Fusarium chuoi]|nr:hypothetical protein LB505_010790 [Fusarium chuoi]